MSKQKSVVIVGRVNVGKSSLFNRLSSDVKSMTMDYEGVTRDFVRGNISWKEQTFTITDTGGVRLRKTSDPVLIQVREQALQLIEQADVIIFVCDGSVGSLPEDRQIAKLLHKMGKQVIVAVNKVDRKDALERLHEFEQLGFEQIVPVSAEHGIGTTELLDAVVPHLPTVGPSEERPSFRVALLGKPNVGKSSLMNLLSGQERAIVAEKAGTTREALAAPVQFYQQNIQLSDTPGVRRQRAVGEPIEQLMVKSAFAAVRDADIVLLVIDASAGRISDQELKLAFYVFEEQKRALIVLLNKHDIVEQEAGEELAHELGEYRHLFNKVPLVTISCKTGKNIGKILPLIRKVWERHTRQFAQAELTAIFVQALTHRPLHRQRRVLKIMRAKQIKTAPITIALWVNYPALFGPSQLTFLEKVLRKKHTLTGVPIKFLVEKRKKRRK